MLDWQVLGIFSWVTATPIRTNVQCGSPILSDRVHEDVIASSGAGAHHEHTGDHCGHE
jgi:hypothetical protein